MFCTLSMFYDLQTLIVCECNLHKCQFPYMPSRRRFGIFIVNFEHFTPCSSVSIVNIEHVIAGWVGFHLSRN